MIKLWREFCGGCGGSGGSCTYCQGHGRGGVAPEWREEEVAWADEARFVTLRVKNGAQEPFNEVRKRLVDIGAEERYYEEQDVGGNPCMSHWEWCTGDKVVASSDSYKFHVRTELLGIFFKGDERRLFEVNAENRIIIE
jgi:hypothetical protein